MGDGNPKSKCMIKKLDLSMDQMEEEEGDIPDPDSVTALENCTGINCSGYRGN